MPIHTFTQQAARFADVHGITGCAGDDVKTLAERQENVPCGLGRGTMPACLINGQVLHLAALQRKVPAVSRLFLCFGRVLTSKCLRFEGRR